MSGLRSKRGKKFGNMVWGVKTRALLTPPSFPQDNDVLLHWAPVEEAGDSTQILFKKVGFSCSVFLHLPFFLGPGDGRHLKELGTIPELPLEAGVTLAGFL